jgi:hypothetical protein
MFIFSELQAIPHITYLAKLTIYSHIKRQMPNCGVLSIIYRKEAFQKRRISTYYFSCHSVLGSILQPIQHPLKFRQFK